MTSLASIVLVFKIFPFLKILKHTFAGGIEVKGELSKLKPAEKIKGLWLILKDKSVSTKTWKDSSLLAGLRGETHLLFPEQLQQNPWLHSLLETASLEHWPLGHLKVLKPPCGVEFPYFTMPDLTGFTVYPLLTPHLGTSPEATYHCWTCLWGGHLLPSLLFRHFFCITDRAGPDVLSVMSCTPPARSYHGLCPVVLVILQLCKQRCLSLPVCWGLSLGESSLWCSGGSADDDSHSSLGQAVISYRDLEKQTVSAEAQNFSEFMLRWMNADVPK